VKLFVLFALIVSLVLLIAVSALTQTLEDAQQAAKAMGYTGTLRADSEVGGITMYSGKGLALMYGGVIAGSRLIKAPVDSELNRGAKRVTSAEGAIARVKEFIEKYGAPVGISAPPELVVASAEPDSGHGYSGWSVDLHVEENGHRGLPAYKASVDSTGAVVNLLYVPLANKVASEPTITRDQARDALLRKVGETGDYTYKSSELEVMPDQRGGCALGRCLALRLPRPGHTGSMGQWTQPQAKCCGLGQWAVYRLRCTN